MKKQFICGVAIFLILGLCSCSNGKENPPPIDTFDFTVEDFYDRLDGSTVMLPLAEKIAVEKFPFLEGRTDYIIFAKTDEATKAVINGTKDLALVTYPSDENLQLAVSKGVELAINPIVNDAFVFLVSNDVPVDGLTTQQIKDIYTGKITNWDQIPGCNYHQEIAVFSRNETSGSQKGMIDFMGTEAENMIEVEEAMRPVGMGFLVDEMAARQGAIGYSYYYYVTEQYASTLKLLAVDGIAPNSSSISKRTYPICVCYYAVYRADEKQTSFAYRFTQYLISEEGQNYAEEIGYVKLSEDQAISPKSGNADGIIYPTIPFSLKDIQEKTVRTDGTEFMLGSGILSIDSRLNDIFGLRLVSQSNSPEYGLLENALNLLLSDEKEACLFMLYPNNDETYPGMEESYTISELEELYPTLKFRTFRTETTEYSDRVDYFFAINKNADPNSFGERFYLWLCEQAA